MHFICIFVIIIVIINSFLAYSSLRSWLFHMCRHLARNPFICDCNLRWLADYLHKNPIETSGARCDAPKRMHRRRIEALRDEKFKCKYCSSPFGWNITAAMKSDERWWARILIFAGNNDYRTRDVSCRVDTECPAACHCERTTVDCSARGLKEIPRDIPLYTTEL